MSSIRIITILLLAVMSEVLVTESAVAQRHRKRSDCGCCLPPCELVPVQAEELPQSEPNESELNEEPWPDDFAQDEEEKEPEPQPRPRCLLEESVCKIIKIPLGHSQVVSVDFAIAHVTAPTNGTDANGQAISSCLAQILTSTGPIPSSNVNGGVMDSGQKRYPTRNVLLTAKSLGESTVTIWSDRHYVKPVAIRVKVINDPNQHTADIEFFKELHPDAEIEILVHPSSDVILVKGGVQSTEQAEDLFEILQANSSPNQMGPNGTPMPRTKIVSRLKLPSGETVEAPESGGGGYGSTGGYGSNNGYGGGSYGSESSGSASGGSGYGGDSSSYGSQANMGPGSQSPGNSGYGGESSGYGSEASPSSEGNAAPTTPGNSGYGAEQPSTSPSNYGGESAQTGSGS